MSRMARLVVPGLPHHIVQRTRRRADLFPDRLDPHRYLDLLAEYAAKHGLGIRAYCLLKDHVHLVAVPEREESLAAVMKPLAMRYAQYVGRSAGGRPRGRLWQGRPQSCPLDETHFWAAVRYVERHPVESGLVVRAERYGWASGRTHCGHVPNPLVTGRLERLGVVDDWAAWLRDPPDPALVATLHACTRTGRPAGSPEFVARIEKGCGRPLAAPAPGRPPRHPPGA